MLSWQAGIQAVRTASRVGERLLTRALGLMSLLTMFVVCRQITILPSSWAHRASEDLDTDSIGTALGGGEHFITLRCILSLMRDRHAFSNVPHYREASGEAESRALDSSVKGNTPEVFDQRRCRQHGGRRGFQ